MRNPSLHRIITVGITALVCLSLAGAWLLVTRTSFFLAFLCALAIGWIAVELVKRTGKRDRQLESFFSTIRDQDFTTHFTTSDTDPYTRGLFREMNRITALLETNRVQHEEQRLYYESIVRVLAHEIRNSIAPIASLSADLVSHPAEYGTEGMLDGLRTIHQQAQHLHTFLDAYHRLTHLPEPVKSNVPVSELFDKLHRLLAAEPGSQYIRYTVRQPLEIGLDPQLITLALINLIRNALQATAGHPSPHIEVEAGCEGTTPFIQVTDNGEGIPPGRLPDVFTPFYSTRREGSGIGLPLSRRIMHLHNGHLTLTSTPGQTTSRMTFPG